MEFDPDYDYDNTMEKGMFVYLNILNLYTTTVIYRKYLLKSIDGFSEQTSVRIFWFTLAVSFVLMVFSEMKRRRNYPSLFFNVACAFGIYTVCSYIYYMPRLIPIVIVTAGIISAVWVIYVLGRKIRNRAKRSRIMKNRIHIAISSVQKCFTVGFVLIYICLGVKLYGTAGTATIAVAYSDENYEEIVAENMDTLSILLDTEAWEELSSHERLEILQMVVNLEQYRLGIPYEIKLVDGIVEDAGGFYADEYHQITLKADLVADRTPDILVPMVCHEVYHAYEYCLVELYENADESLMDLAVFQKAKVYKEEFENYVSISEDYETYYNQVSESDAREYAEAAAESFFETLLACEPDAAAGE